MAVYTGWMAVNAVGDQPGQQVEPVDVGLLAVVDAGAFQHVEDVEDVAHGLAVEQAVAGQAHGLTGDGLRDGDDQSLAVDAFDGVAAFAEHQAFAVVLLLRAVERIDEQVAERVVVGHGFEQLRVDAGGAAFVAGVLVGRAVLAGRVALGQLWRRRAG